MIPGSSPWLIMLIATTLPGEEDLPEIHGAVPIRPSGSGQRRRRSDGCRGEEEGQEVRNLNVKCVHGHFVQQL